MIEHSDDLLLPLIPHDYEFENVGLGLFHHLLIGVVNDLQNVIVIDDSPVAPAKLDYALVDDVLEHVVYLLPGGFELNVLLVEVEVDLALDVLFALEGQFIPGLKHLFLVVLVLLLYFLDDVLS